MDSKIVKRARVVGALWMQWSRNDGGIGVLLFGTYRSINMPVRVASPCRVTVTPLQLPSSTQEYQYQVKTQDLK